MKISLIIALAIVVFALSVFIPLQCSLKKVHEISAPPPSADGSQSASNIIVTIRADSSLHLNGEPIDFEALEKLLKEKRSDPATTVTVKPESDQAFGTTVEVLDAIRRAGIQ